MGPLNNVKKMSFQFTFHDYGLFLLNGKLIGVR